MLKSQTPNIIPDETEAEPLQSDDKTEIFNISKNK